MEEKKELVVMSTKLRPEIAEKVKYLAKKTDMTTSRFLSNVIETVIPDLMVCEKLGVFQLSYLLQDLKHQLKSWSEFVTTEQDDVGTPA
jgi:predicted DNA-binding protein